MIYSKLILILYFIFKIGYLGALKTAFSVIDNSAIVKTENFLIEFMTDLRELSFKKSENPYWSTILGKNENFLQSTKVLLDNDRPYLVGTKTKITSIPLRFGANSVMLFFIDGFNNFEINSAFDNLPKEYTCKVLIISMNENTTEQTLAKTIDSAAKTKIRNVSFARFDGQVMKIYRKILSLNCEEKVTLFNEWMPKKGFMNNESIFGAISSKASGHGCPMVVSTLDLPPMMDLRKNENGTLQISGGNGGHLVRSIAEYFNMVPVVKLPAVEELFCILPNGTVSGIVGEVSREMAILGIGQIRPTTERLRRVDFTMSHDHECMVWTVPLDIKYNYSVLISEFSPATWILLILSVTLCCALAHAVSKFHGGSRSSLNTFDIIALTLNYAVPRYPTTSIFCKCMFLLYLHYSRVISTAYSASLSSILTAPAVETTIADEDGILRSGLRTMGTKSALEILLEQVSDPNSKTSELVERYEIETSIDAALSRIVDHKDAAYLRHYSSINYAMTRLLMRGKPIGFYVPPGCVISYNSVMVTQKGSHLTNEISDLILRLRDAGIDRLWRSLDRTSILRMKSLPSYNYTLSGLRTIFILYMLCLIPASLAFAFELISFKRKMKSMKAL